MFVREGPAGRGRRIARGTCASHGCRPAGDCSWGVAATYSVARRNGILVIADDSDGCGCRLGASSIACWGLHRVRASQVDCMAIGAVGGLYRPMSEGTSDAHRRAVLTGNRKSMSHAFERPHTWPPQCHETRV